MDESQLADLIRRVIQETRAQPSSARPKPTALVLFSGALLGFEEALASLARLSDEVSLDWTQTPSAERILDNNKIAAVGMTPVAESSVSSHDLLIVPTLTVNLVGKVANGIGDCLASNTMAEFIMTGRQVVATVNGSCPDNSDKRSWFPNMPSGYAAMLREALDRLRSFGIKLTPAASLDQAVREVLKTSVAPAPTGSFPGVVTAETLTDIPAGGTLRIGPKTIVTALAQEIAASRNITITTGS